MEVDDSNREALLEKCILTARDRSRFGDKLICFERAGRQLAGSENGRLAKLASECLAMVNQVNLSPG